MNLSEMIQKKCNEDPEFQTKWEEHKRLQKEFEIAVKPLVEFLQKNYNPMTKVIVECDKAEITTGEMMIGFDTMTDNTLFQNTMQGLLEAIEIEHGIERRKEAEDELVKQDGLKALMDIRKFKKDWNGYGANPIPTEIIDKCEIILKLLKTPLELYPTGRGTIQFEHSFEDKTYFEIEIYEKKIGILIVPKREYDRANEFDLLFSDEEQIANFINGVYYILNEYSKSNKEIQLETHKVSSQNHSVITSDIVTQLLGDLSDLPEKAKKYFGNIKENSMKEIKIKYFTDKIEKIRNIDDKSDWYDLRSAEDITLKAGEFKLIPLGVAMQLPTGYEAHVVPRSSTFKNYGVIQTNSQGVIDNSYCGDNDQWFMPVYALRDTEIHVNDRVCQFRIVEKQSTINFTEVDVLGNEDRGGHGSTGKQ